MKLLYCLEHRYIRGDKMAIPIPMPRQESTSEFHSLGDNEEVEYFFASDASAIIEHTNQVIYLEVRTIIIVFTIRTCYRLLVIM